MQTNTTKAKLKDGQTVFGCFVRYPSAALVEVLGFQPLDFIVIDAEHGTVEPIDCEHMVRAIELRGVTPIVRVTTNQPHIILRYMDSGAQGAHVPWVNSGAEAEAAVRSIKYHPRGVRGLAGTRAVDYGQSVAYGEAVAKVNAESLIAIHIETIQAVDALPDIVAVDGIDVIFIGPTDLSHSLGVPGNVQHPSVQSAIDRIVDAVRGTDKALGIMVGNSKAAREWKERGARYITIGLESLMVPALRDYLNAVRA